MEKKRKEKKKSDDESSDKSMWFSLDFAESKTKENPVEKNTKTEYKTSEKNPKGLTDDFFI